MKLLDKLASEPVAVQGVIKMGLGVGTALGVLHFNDSTSQLIVAEVGTVLTIASTLFARAKVSPVSKLNSLNRAFLRNPWSGYGAVTGTQEPTVGPSTPSGMSTSLSALLAPPGPDTAPLPAPTPPVEP